MNGRQSLWAPKFFLWLGLLVTASMVWRVGPDWHYYLLPYDQRPMYPHHDFLRSSGYGGLSFGIIGTVLIFLNLTYLIRKQLIFWEWLGALRSWMSFHVFTGLVGAAFVLLHSALRPRSALGILGFAALGIVVVTGVIGRYIYAHTPRSLEGRELELDEIRRRLAAYQAGLEKLGMPHEFFEKALAASMVHGTDSGVLSALFGLVVGDLELRREYHGLRRMVHASAILQPLAREVLPLALRYSQERQWLARYNQLRALMGGWRFMHRWLAILLLAAASFHIWVAIRLGNLWILK